MIKLHDLEFEPFISESEISATIDRLAATLNRDYAGQKPVFIAVLNGAFMFATEIVKRFKGDCEISFVKLGSYEGTESTGNVKTLLGLNQDLKGRKIVLLEDIIDTGNTLEELEKIFSTSEIDSWKVVTLFYKPEAYKKSIPIEYIGMEIPNKFIVGYGLDYDGLGRNLTQVYKRKENKMTNLVLFGPPGAGKGTQATILKDKYDLIHISTGDVFRFNIKNQTKLGLSAKAYMDKGQLVPDEVTINMLKAEVEKNEAANGFIFDGFPRTEAQAEALDNFLESFGQKVDAMIALEVEDNILVERLLERGKTSGRPDDADETVIRNRIKVYYDETAILKDFYQKRDRYFGVDGVGSIEEITERLSIVIDRLMK